MKARTLLIALALLASCGIGILGEWVFSTKQVPEQVMFYSNELNLLELRRQSKMLGYLLNKDEAKVSEFLVDGIQGNLAHFAAVVAKKDKTLNKTKLCQLLSSPVLSPLDEYARIQPSQTKFAQEDLKSLMKWCGSTPQN